MTNTNARKSVTVVMVMVMCILVSTIFIAPICANAATDGYYTYTIEGGEATITDVDKSITGNITIPSTLGGYPVTVIGYEAFESCRMLTKVTIPDNVKIIDFQAFF